MNIVLKEKVLLCYLLLMYNNHYGLGITVDTLNDLCVGSIDQQSHYVSDQLYVLIHQHILHTKVGHYDYRHNM